MSWQNKIDFRLQCAACRQVLDTKDMAYCRLEEVGYTGVVINPKPCVLCQKNAQERGEVEGARKAQQTFEEKHRHMRDELTELRALKARAKKLDEASMRIAKTLRGRLIGWLTRKLFPEESKI